MKPIKHPEENMVYKGRDLTEMQVRAGAYALGLTILDGQDKPEPDSEEPDQTYRPSLRSRLYGRARVNNWPLWIAWLLASGRSRQTVKELRELRKAGVDV